MGDASFDEKAGSLSGLFDFNGRFGQGRGGRLLLNPDTGRPSG
jgi:hypothetical protein